MTDSQPIKFYGEFSKFEELPDGTLMVSGIVSSEAEDSDGEMTTADAMRKALPAYLQKGSVREMHLPIAAGTPISAYVADDGKTHATVHVVDKGTIQKVKTKVLKGFSIGGKKIKQVGKQITELLLKEISLVDVPANPDCYFNIAKFDKSETEKSMKCKHCDGDKTEGHECEGMKEKKADMKKFDDLSEMVNKLATGLETLTKSLNPAENKPDEPTLADIAKSVNDLKSAPKTSDSFVFKVDGKDVVLKGEDIMKHMVRTEEEIKKANELVANNDLKNILEKMAREGRVAFNESGVAYKADELQKMDLKILKVLANNAPVLPTEARAIYKGEGKMDSAMSGLKGTDLIQKSWESDYGSLASMRQKFPIGN